MKIKYESVDALDIYAQHLKNLTPEDRYTRFCYNIKDAGIDQFILSILYNRHDHHLFSAAVEDQIVGFVHMARENSNWELAVSVDKNFQGLGIADQLMSHAITWGKTHGIHTLFMHCITQNTKIQHLARKHGLRIVERDGSEVTSQVELPAATPLDYTADFMREQRDLAHQIIDLQQKMLRNLNPLTYVKEHTLD